MRRVSVVGTSGSGKSWVASRLSTKLGVPWLELDALRHQQNWEPLPDAEFVDRVASFVHQDGWVVDGNYADLVTEAVVWPAADAVVWIDLPRHLVMRRLVRRTLIRWARREELWNGNRERLRDSLHWDPDKSVIRWAWTSHARNRERYASAMTDPRWRRLRFIRLTSPDEIRRYLDETA